jgi:hypothetical protein
VFDGVVSVRKPEKNQEGNDTCVEGAGGDDLGEERAGSGSAARNCGNSG